MPLQLFFGAIGMRTCNLPAPKPRRSLPSNHCVPQSCDGSRHRDQKTADSRPDSAEDSSCAWDLFYIGKVKKTVSEDIFMKFLEKSGGNFGWPKRDQEEMMNIKFIFYGPVQLYGNDPSTMDIHQIIIAYKCYKKNRLAIWK
ncbi:hypothetical protein AVEN_143000-1 [Araneus ventricosus]|uniref:Uncharacterized protein n=1 Tax=Araneus ventricosus TaxID=182803 RepID=A0A4Y2WT72_ARAVE|nr:hypothetical protein AVEN_130569-1 [Araneus ventricosus]GBO39825.1 hypothetical protein AVEN_143000-1 [Araneus ventricosus]